MSTSLLKPLPSYSTASSFTPIISSITSPNLVSSSVVASSIPSSTRTKNNPSSLLYGFASSSNSLLTTSSSLSSSSTQIQPTQILVKELQQATQRPISTQRQISCPASIPTLTLPSSNNSKLLLVTTGKNNKVQEITSHVTPSSTFILNTGEQMTSHLQFSNTISLPSYQDATGILSSSRSVDSYRFL